MEKIRLTVRALAAQMGISIEELAEKCGISFGHLKQVSAGNVAMTAYDLKMLSRVTGVPTDNIFVKDFDE
jgi:transcriptional regulator with XRE-family HTH domain